MSDHIQGDARLASLIIDIVDLLMKFAIAEAKLQAAVPDLQSLNPFRRARAKRAFEEANSLRGG